jgi:hypothetical protein
MSQRETMCAHLNGETMNTAQCYGVASNKAIVSTTRYPRTMLFDVRREESGVNKVKQI